MTESAEAAPEPSRRLEPEQAEQAQPWASDPLQRDIASHRPGHALVAKIGTLLIEAGITAPVVAEMLPPTVRDQLRPWAVGFVGEERLGVELAWLDSRWRVLHSVPVGTGGADIDHLLIGPAGVFTVNSKHHPGGRVDVRGDAVFLGTTFMGYVPVARSEARRARNCLSARGVNVEVCPLVCVVGAGSLRVLEAPEGVKVLGTEELVRHLNSLPTVATRSTADAAFDAARHPNTWPGTPTPPAPDWVVELARALGTSALTGAAPKRRARAGTFQQPIRSVPPAAPTRARPARSGGSRRLSGPRRALTGCAAMLAAVLLVPPVLTWTMQGIVDGARSAIPTRSPSSAPYIAATDMEVGYPGGDCPTASARARHPLGNLLICRKNDDGERVWVYADPWLRLPVQSDGVICTIRGAHARSYFGEHVTLVCAGRQDEGSLRWAVDPTFQPED